MMSAYSSAMPGTGRRLLSLTSKALRNASRGRGSIVTMMVSSMSLTRPNSSPGPTMRTGSSTGSASSVEPHRVPAGLEVGLEAHVNVAVADAGDHVAVLSDLDRPEHRRGTDANPDRRVLAGVRGGWCQQHARQHPDPTVGAVPDVQHCPGGPSKAAATVDHRVQSRLGASRAVRSGDCRSWGSLRASLRTRQPIAMLRGDRRR